MVDLANDAQWNSLALLRVCLYLQSIQQRIRDVPDNNQRNSLNGKSDMISSQVVRETKMPYSKEQPHIVTSILLISLPGMKMKCALTSNHHYYDALIKYNMA